MNKTPDNIETNEDGISPSDEDSFGRVVELIGEMSLGVGPDIRVQYFDPKIMDAPETRVVPLRDMSGFFEAIYRKLKQTPEYQPVKTARLEASMMHNVNRKLRDRNAALEEIVEAVAHIGVVFGYGQYELEPSVIEKARKLMQNGESNGV